MTGRSSAFRSSPRTKLLPGAITPANAAPTTSRAGANVSPSKAPATTRSAVKSEKSSLATESHRAEPNEGFHDCQSVESTVVVKSKKNQAPPPQAKPKEKQDFDEIPPKVGETSNFNHPYPPQQPSTMSRPTISRSNKFSGSAERINTSRPLTLSQPVDVPPTILQAPPAKKIIKTKPIKTAAKDDDGDTEVSATITLARPPGKKAAIPKTPDPFEVEDFE